MICRAWFLASFVLALSLSAPPALAITPEEAEQLVIDNVITGHPDEPILVAFLYQRGAPDPALQSGDTVETADGLVSFTATEPTYFFWIDLKGGTEEWWHDCTYVFVTVADGTLTEIDALSWPHINGAEYSGFTDETTDNFYGAYGGGLEKSTMFVGDPGSIQNAPRVEAGLSDLVGNSFAGPNDHGNPGACVLIAVGRNRDGANERSSRMADVNRVMDYLTNNPRGPGLDSAQVTTLHGTPSSPWNGADKEDVCTALETILGNPNCQKVYFFYAGHGTNSQNTGLIDVTASMVFRDKTTGEAEYMKYREFACKFFEARPAMLPLPEVCVVVEACHSGAVTRNLEKNATREGLAKSESLKGIVISSSSTENVTFRSGDGTGTPFYKGLENCSADLIADLDGNGHVELDEAVIWAAVAEPGNTTVPQINPLGSNNSRWVRTRCVGLKGKQIKNNGPGRPYLQLVCYKWKRRNPPASAVRCFFRVYNNSGDAHVSTNLVRITCTKRDGSTHVITPGIKLDIGGMAPGRFKSRWLYLPYPPDCRRWRCEVVPSKPMARAKVPHRLERGPVFPDEIRTDVFDVADAELFLQYEHFDILPGETHTNDLGPSPPWGIGVLPTSFVDVGGPSELLVEIRGFVPPAEPMGLPIVMTHTNDLTSEITEVTYHVLTRSDVPGSIGAGTTVTYEAVDILGGGIAATPGPPVVFDHAGVKLPTTTSVTVDPGGRLELIQTGVEPDSLGDFSTDLRGEIHFDAAALAEPLTGLRLDGAMGEIFDTAVLGSQAEGVHMTGDLSGLHVEGLTILESAGVGLIVDDTGFRPIEGLHIEDSGGDDIHVLNGSNLFALDSSFDPGKTSVDATSVLARAWTQIVEVVDTQGAPVADLGVTVTDSEGMVEFTDSTDTSGFTDFFPSVEWVDQGGTTLSLNPHEVLLSDGTDMMSFSVTVTEQGRITLVWDPTTSSDPPPRPRRPALSVRPNPFNPTAAIDFALDRAGTIEISVFDARGKSVRVLEQGYWDAGRHSVFWNGLTNDGRAVSSGVYYVKLVPASGHPIVRKACLVR